MKTRALILMPTLMLILLPRAWASHSCLEAARERFATSEREVVDCQKAGTVSFVLEEKRKSSDEASVNLVVYDTHALETQKNPVPLAVRERLGERLLRFKHGDNILEGLRLDPGPRGRPGIVFLTYVQPGWGVFNSFRFDPPTMELHNLNDGFVRTSVDEVPVISADGRLRTQDRAFDADRVEREITRTWRYDHGRFIFENVVSK